jgi:mannose-6-phosphate isomerase-like protein (cupin superfamily)
MSSNYKEERPWGSFEILHEEEGLKVKRIIVKPGKRLSLQSHKHRSENWVIIRGLAIVTRDDEEISRRPNQAIYIPAGAKHRCANPGDEEVVFIEVQTGTYLGEDDIVRYEDDFNRV